MLLTCPQKVIHICTNVRIIVCTRNSKGAFMCPMVQYPGDEIDVLNDSWLFLMWSSDHCPYSTDSACSRWPVAVIPKSLYVIDASGINLTVAAATREIVASFNRLSTDGIKLRDVPSMGRNVVTWFCPGMLPKVRLYIQFF